jgi:hypothetical protein
MECYLRNLYAVLGQDTSVGDAFSKGRKIQGTHCQRTKFGGTIRQGPSLIAEKTETGFATLPEIVGTIKRDK